MRRGKWVIVKIKLLPNCITPALKRGKETRNDKIGPRLEVC